MRACYIPFCSWLISFGPHVLKKSGNTWSVFHLVRNFFPYCFLSIFFFTLFFAVTFSVYINDRLPVVMKELPKGDNQIEGRSAQLCQCHLFVSSLLFQANLESPVTQRANSAAISHVVFHIFFSSTYDHDFNKIAPGCLPTLFDKSDSKIFFRRNSLFEPDIPLLHPPTCLEREKKKKFLVVVFFCFRCQNLSFFRWRANLSFFSLLNCTCDNLTYGAWHVVLCARSHPQSSAACLFSPEFFYPSWFFFSCTQFCVLPGLIFFALLALSRLYPRQ